MKAPKKFYVNHRPASATLKKVATRSNPGSRPAIDSTQRASDLFARPGSPSLAVGKPRVMTVPRVLRPSAGELEAPHGTRLALVPVAAGNEATQRTIQRPTDDLGVSDVRVTDGASASMAKTALLDTSGAAIEPSGVEPVGASASNTLAALLDAVKRVAQALEVIAEATVTSRSRGHGSKRPKQVVDPALLAELAGKQMLDIATVESLVGAKRSTIYGWIQDGKFVEPVRLSAKSSRWVASEVEAWLDEKTRTRDEARPVAVIVAAQEVAA